MAAPAAKPAASVEDAAAPRAFEAAEPLAAPAEASWRPNGRNNLVNVLPLVVVSSAAVEQPDTVGLRLQTDAADSTEPNELTQSINHERMPVLMSDPTDFETWLSGSTEEAFKLARSYAAEQMRIVQSVRARGSAESGLATHRRG